MWTLAQAWLECDHLPGWLQPLAVLLPSTRLAGACHPLQWAGSKWLCHVFLFEQRSVAFLQSPWARAECRCSAHGAPTGLELRAKDGPGLLGERWPAGWPHSALLGTTARPLYLPFPAGHHLWAPGRALQ